MSASTTTKLLLSASASLLLIGCASHGQLSEDFYKASSNKKIKEDAVIGVMSDPEYPPEKISYSSAGISCDLDVSNAGKAITSEIASIYKTAKEIESEDECPECDAFAIYRFRYDLGQLGASVGYEGIMEVDYITKNGSIITTKSSSARGTASAIGAGVLAGATLGLGGPIAAQVYGQVMQEEIEKSLTKMISQIGRSTKRDKSLTAESIKRWDNYEEEESTPQPVNPKIDTALKATVVIKNGRGLGSGFFVRNGIVITNAHVVEGATNVSVKLKNGKIYRGLVLKTDEARDLAAIRVPVSNHSIISLDDSVSQGDPLIAIGVPKSLSWSVTRGVLSAFRTDSNGIMYIQTDTPINAGNSGGPLLSQNSMKAIGVSTFKYVSNDIEGLNFAISSKEVKRFIKGIR